MKILPFDYDMDEREFFNKLAGMFSFSRKKVKTTKLEEEENNKIFLLWIRLRKGQRTPNGFQKLSGKGYEKLYQECRDVINEILTKYNYQPTVPGKKAGKDGIHHIPAAVKVLVYYMAY